MLRRSKLYLGFTLVELLIAVAITSLIVVLLGAAFASLTKAASRANQRVDAFRDARAALHMIERDLTGVIRAANTAYFALDSRYSEQSPPTIKNRQVYALIAAKNAGNGDLCAVGYYCRWDTTKHAYSLNRYFRDSNEIMAQSGYFSGIGRSVPPWNILGNILAGGPGSYMRSDHLYQPSDIDAPKGNPATFKDDVLASYVWNLQITAYKADGTKDTSDPLIMDPSNPAAQMPVALEISFSAISPEAAKIIGGLNATPNDWMDSTAPNHRFLTPSTYDFRTRVNL